jgi:hypothetical protein
MVWMEMLITYSDGPCGFCDRVFFLCVLCSCVSCVLVFLRQACDGFPEAREIGQVRFGNDWQCNKVRWRYDQGTLTTRQLGVSGMGL